METLYPASYVSSSDWFVPESQSQSWTREENKQFETALAMYDKDTPDRWLKVAAMIPGKTEFDVLKQYKELLEDVCDIEAGRVPIPGYLASPFSLELVDDRNFDAYRKRSLVVRGCDQERKKGVPWTEEEHRRFLMGLLKYGKGDWRNISRNFVVSKTPTQVASHAQKYFIRQHSGGKDKRRPSIHDITTVNLTDATLSDNNHKPSLVLEQSNMFPLHEEKPAGMSKVVLEWNQSNDGSLVFFDSTDQIQGNVVKSSPYDIASNGLKLQGQNLFGGAHVKSYKSMFQIQSARHQIHG